MTQRLNQVLAAEKATKTHAEKDITAAYHTLQKPALFDGVSRTYQPIADGGEVFPAEKTAVQQRAEEVLGTIRRNMAAVWDVTAAKDFANTEAKANVVYNGTTLLKDAPATFLLYLEKQLADLYTEVSKAPTLDPAATWTMDANDGLFRSEPQKTVKTKKVPVPITLAPATDKHPAQVQLGHDDVTIGYWTQVKASGALPHTRKQVLLDRIERMQRAVKYAREEANQVEAPEKTVGAAILDAIFA